jgi:hypothetical protein
MDPKTIQRIALAIGAILIIWLLIKIYRIATGVGKTVAAVGAAVTGERYIAPTQGYIRAEPYAEPTFLDGIMQTIGQGENINPNAPSSSLLQAQQAARMGIDTDNLVGWMDVAEHNLAGIKGMNL